MKKVSRARLNAIAKEDGAKVVLKPKSETPQQHKPQPEGIEAAYGKALEGIDAAVRVIRATGELNFTRAEKTDVLIEKLTERLEGQAKADPVPYKLTVKRDGNGLIEEVDAAPILDFSDRSK